MIINGDEFRRYHPDFEDIQAPYGKNAPKYTAAFSGMMTERVIAKALAEGYNVSVEGTFRTAGDLCKTPRQQTAGTFFIMFRLFLRKK
nr:zeta toxin family protein [Neisseria sp. 74A18]